MKNSRYNMIVLIGTTALLSLTAALTIIIDPYFHYHKPLADFQYKINNQRYQNDGILRNFDYDAIITGTSMTENFKTTQLDKMFGVKSVLTPFSGSTFKETGDNIKRAINYNDNIKMIIRSIDISRYFDKVNDMRYEDSYYPTYLTNNNPFDDVAYVWNKSVLFNNTLEILSTYSKGSGSVTPFDEAYNWNEANEFGKTAVLANYNRKDTKAEKNVVLTKEQLLDIQKNIDVNLAGVVKDNPEIQFYYFITPYSVVFWDSVERIGTLDMTLLAEKMIIESLIEYDNIHFFSFSDNLSITADLNNYKDIAHYSENVNSYILQCMKEDKHRLTKDNYKEYLERMNDIYSNYDYDSLFQ